MRELSTLYGASAVLLSCLFFVHCSDTGLPVQASTVETHYYLYEYIDEDGQPAACEVENQGAGAVSPVSPGPEFEEVTLEELHEKGYLSPDEELALTPPENVNVVGGVAGLGASWLRFWVDPLYPDLKQHSCGSRTTTTEAVYVKVHAWRYKIDPVTNEVIEAVPGVDENICGPATVHVSWHGHYNINRIWRWHIHGDHYWVNHNLPLLMTDVWGDF